VAKYTSPAGTRQSRLQSAGDGPRSTYSAAHWHLSNTPSRCRRTQAPVDNVENPGSRVHCSPERAPELWNSRSRRTLTAHDTRPTRGPEAAIRVPLQSQEIANRRKCAAKAWTCRPPRSEKPLSTTRGQRSPGADPAGSRRGRGPTAGGVPSRERTSSETTRASTETTHTQTNGGPSVPLARSPAARIEASSACCSSSAVPACPLAWPCRRRHYWTKGAHGAQTAKKPTFPIFNRKGGVCGLRLPLFCTFSTAVDDSVDNDHVPPAKSRSSHWGIPCPQGPFGTKELHFAHFPSGCTCGKSA
jgi:hypothetical protein